MKKIKVLAALLAIVVAAGMLMACGGGSKSGDKVLVMATEPTFAPYEYTKGTEVVGIDVDIAKEVAKDLGAELKIETMDFDAVIPSVQSSKSDFGASGISITEDRLKEVDFSIPYTETIQVILTTKDSGINKLEDLFGKKVGVQMGTTSDLMIQEDYPDIELAPGKQYTDIAMDLANGKIDAIVLDQLPAENILKTNDNFTIAESEFYKDSYAFAVKKGNDELLESMNKTIQRLIDEGKIQEYTDYHTAASE